MCWCAVYRIWGSFIGKWIDSNLRRTLKVWRIDYQYFSNHELRDSGCTRVFSPLFRKNAVTQRWHWCNSIFLVWDVIKLIWYYRLLWMCFRNWCHVWCAAAVNLMFFNFTQFCRLFVCIILSHFRRLFNEEEKASCYSICLLLSLDIFFSFIKIRKLYRENVSIWISIEHQYRHSNKQCHKVEIWIRFSLKWLQFWTMSALLHFRSFYLVSSLF